MNGERGKTWLKHYHWLWMPLVAFIITRLGVAAAAYFATPIITDSNVPPYHIRPDNILIDVFGSRWDTGFYLSIAEEGYQFDNVPLPSGAFFPLYPMLIRAASVLIRDPLSAGILISNMALLAGAILLYRLAADEWDQGTADRAIWYLLIFPASFFGSAIYTESLFLLLGTAALYLARKDRWWAAGLVSVLASLTRFVGIILAPVLVIEWLQQRKNAAKRMVDENEPQPIPGWKDLVGATLAPVGTLLYMLYSQLTFGDALIFVRASQAWARQPESPLLTVAEILTRPVQGWSAALAAGAIPLDNWVDFFFVVVFVVIGIVLLVQRRWSEGAYVLLGAIIPLSSGLLMS